MVLWEKSSFLTSPEISPSCMTRIRSLMPMISSISEETTMMALPWAASWLMIS